MDANRKIVVPVIVLMTGVLLAVFQHPVLGGEIVAAALMLMREPTREPTK